MQGIRGAGRWARRLAAIAPLCAGTASAGTLTIAGSEIPPGEKQRVEIATSQSFAGMQVATPVWITRGEIPGPTLCLTAGVHGDELVGVEAVRRVSQDLMPVELRGSVVAIPIANPHGFRRSSRYLPDRRDLNRFFPGREWGSAASRIAFRIFDGVVRHCDYLVDFHTGSFHRTNTPHVRADVRDPKVARLARWFRAPIVIHNAGAEGTLRRAAVDAGIPAITFEAGEPMRFEPEGIEAGVAGVERLMAALGMIERPADPGPGPEFYYRTSWVRVDNGGILLTSAHLGGRVRAGDVLGTVTDPISNQSEVVTSPFSGRLVGMALSQVVIPGFAAFHVAVEGPTLREVEGEEGEDEDVALGPPLDEDPLPEE